MLHHLKRVVSTTSCTWMMRTCPGIVSSLKPVTNISSTTVESEKFTKTTSSNIFMHSTNDIQRRYFRSTAISSDPWPLMLGVGVGAAALTLHYAKEGASKLSARRAKGEPMFGSSMFGSKYYDGGFEDEMSRREAALILGIRESADKKRVQKSYRSLLRQNHPDAGGSTYLAAKINEAKDILLTGKE